LLLLRVLEELLRHWLCMNSGGHVVVPFISQHTNNFRRQDLIENADNRFPVGTVATGDGALLHVLASAAAKFPNVCHEWTMVFFNRSCCHCYSCFLMCRLAARRKPSTLFFRVHEAGQPLPCGDVSLEWPWVCPAVPAVTNHGQVTIYRYCTNLAGFAVWRAVYLELLRKQRFGPSPALVEA